MGLKNKYGGNCIRCKRWIPAGDGHVEKVTYLHQQIHGTCNKWTVRCDDCVGKGHTRDGNRDIHKSRKCEQRTD